MPRLSLSRVRNRVSDSVSVSVYLCLCLHLSLPVPKCICLSVCLAYLCLSVPFARCLILFRVTANVFAETLNIKQNPKCVVVSALHSSLCPSRPTGVPSYLPTLSLRDVRSWHNMWDLSMYYETRGTRSVVQLPSTAYRSVVQLPSTDVAQDSRTQYAYARTSIRGY